MSFQSFQSFACPAIAMPGGLTAFLLPEGPEMWHEFALGVDFADPKATIDLLIAADRITARDECDRATAVLLLARMAAAGFLCGKVPAGFDAGAARALVRRLSDDLAGGRFTAARFALPPRALRLVRRQLGSAGPLALPALVLAPGRGAHRPRFGFAGWRPVARLPAVVRAAA